MEAIYAAHSGTLGNFHRFKAPPGKQLSGSLDLPPEGPGPGEFIGDSLLQEAAGASALAIGAEVVLTKTSLAIANDIREARPPVLDVHSFNNPFIFRPSC